jgi:hypothetical protein
MFLNRAETLCAVGGSLFRQWAADLVANAGIDDGQQGIALASVSQCARSASVYAERGAAQNVTNCCNYYTDL